MSTLLLSRKRDFSLTLVLLSSILIGLSGTLSIPLFFTPVPLALRGMIVLVLSVLLGYKRAASSVFLFILQAAVGLPVLAGGLTSLVGPTGGYLIGYFMAAATVGFLSEKIKIRSTWNLFWILALGSSLILIIGASYLALFVGVKNAVSLGIVPFLAGDFLKILFSIQILRIVGWNK